MDQFSRRFRRLLEECLQRTKRFVVPPVGDGTTFAKLQWKFYKT